MNMNKCCNCKYWKPTLYDMGECKKINEKIEIELATGWDGGYVRVIETGSDFGCNLFEKLEDDE
jgi:hypothetical protein